MDPNKTQTNDTQTPINPEPLPTPYQEPISPQQVQQPQPPSPNNLDVQHKHQNNPGTIVLQWLTYAFWGWTVFIVSILIFIVLNNIIGNSDSNSFTAYAVAAILVLLPISVVCDVFYSKQESPKKTGGASIVMIIHAVLFALFGIGTLIWMAFSIVTLLTSSSDTSTAKVSLYSSTIVFVLYGALFLRTINPAKFPWIRRVFVMFMVVAVGIVAVLGVVGPAANERSTKNDRLINENLSTVSSSIDDYARVNSRLPATLSQLNLDGDAKKLINDNLIDYKANTKPSTANRTNSSYITNTQDNLPSAIYYYQLCVEYKKASKTNDSNYSSSSNYGKDSDGYDTDPLTYSYPAGQTCYKLKTSDY
jgi:hypothetical protein